MCLTKKTTNYNIFAIDSQLIVEHRSDTNSLHEYAPACQTVYLAASGE